MIDKIISDPTLFSIVCHDCSENNVSINVCDHLLDDGLCDHEKIIILKPDSYYHTQNFGNNTPQSIDCLFIIKNNDKYKLLLAELRDTNRSGYVTPKKIMGKFINTIDIMLKKDFSEIFCNEDYKIEKAGAWLVTDPYNWGGLTDEQYTKKLKSTVLDSYNTQKPLEFRSFLFFVRPQRPNPCICDF